MSIPRDGWASAIVAIVASLQHWDGTTVRRRAERESGERAIWQRVVGSAFGNAGLKLRRSFVAWFFAWFFVLQNRMHSGTCTCKPRSRSGAGGGERAPL